MSADIDIQKKISALKKTVEVLKNRIKSVNNSDFQSSIQKQLTNLHKRDEENQKKKEFAELRAQELEKFNQELEVTVKERTRSIRILLDNSGQGFLAFEKNGVFGGEYSKSTEMIFGKSPAGLKVNDLLYEKDTDWEYLLELLFEEKLPFKDIVPLLPMQLEINARDIKLSYTQVRGDDGKVFSIMVVATDVTEIKKLKEKAKKEEHTNKALIKIISSRNDFIGLLDALESLRAINNDQVAARRGLHTIKGGFMCMECVDVAKLCHTWEDKLKIDFSAELFTAAINDIQKEIDAFISQYAKIINLKGKITKTIPIDITAARELLGELLKARVSPEIIRAFEDITMRPAHEVFRFLSDSFVVTAGKLGKVTDPIEWLPSVNIAPDLYSGLFSSLIHVPRNAADHGIEMPEERLCLGKKEAGQIIAQLKLEDDRYRLSFKDDGSGIDFDAIKRKAEKLGLNVPQNEAEACKILLNSSFSVKDEVTETSGRGIGISALNAEAKKLGGAVELISRAGEGLEIIITFKKMSYEL